MSTLKDQIQSLAKVFADGVLEAIHNASINDLAGAPPTSKRKRASGRAAPSSRDANAEKIRRHVQQHPGCKAQEIVTATSISKSQWNRSVQSALALKLVRKTGVQRGTRYFPI